MFRTTISAICATLSLTLFAGQAQAANGAGAAIAPSAFGSVALAAGKTPYDAKWATVGDRRLGSGERIAAVAQGLTGVARLQFVNSAVNRAITFREDSANWKTGDYWATASQSFARGAGDCEDYAIAKMQILRSAGVPASDLYLVIGNDLTVRSAHAMLVVRVDGDFWVLDNFQDKVRGSQDFQDFKPLVTLSATGRWFHGYRRGSSVTAVASQKTRPTAAATSGSLAAIIAAQGGR